MEWIPIEVRVWVYSIFVREVYIFRTMILQIVTILVGKKTGVYNHIDPAKGGVGWLSGLGEKTNFVAYVTWIQLLEKHLVTDVESLNDKIKWVFFCVFSVKLSVTVNSISLNKLFLIWTKCIYMKWS